MRQHTDLLQAGDEEPDFGTFLKLLRTNKRVKQGTIAALLKDKGWTPTIYTRLENGNIAPRFDDLLPLYRAFLFAGVSFSLSDRQQFVERARTKIERKKTHREQHTDAEWAQLRYELARLDGLPETPLSLPAQVHVPHKPLLADTDHLIGRETWREEILACFRGSARTKVVVIQGPAGIGKSSELNWLATFFFRQTPTTHRVILCDLRSLERTSSPEDAFHVFASTLLTELGYTHPQTPFPSLEEQTLLVLEHLEKARLPLVVFLDHAERLLHTLGELASCWERFLTRLLRGQHRVTLVLASKEWPGWYNGERQFLTEYLLPPLSREKGMLVLQQHGLDSVPISLLEQVYEKVGGIPLALEWVAALVKQPLQVDDWEEFDTARQPSSNARGHSVTQAIERLLAEPHIFGGNLADDIAPLLQRIIATQHLSAEARTLLEVLSVATIPLAKPALQVLCPQGPRPIKELRRASVLVSYPDRTQLLPMVAAAMYRHLTAEQRQEREATLIEACRAWIKQGSLHEQEQSAVITELATLLLKHHQLIEATEHLIYCGWISFNQGHGPRLARLAEKVMKCNHWQVTLETECAGLLLQQLLFPFLGKTIDDQWHEHDKRIRHAFLAKEVRLPKKAEFYLTHLLMLHAMNELCFEEAQAILNTYRSYLESRQIPHLDQNKSLLSERALLLGTWCEYAEEQGDKQKAKALREQVIALYRQYSTLLLTENTPSSLSSSLHKRAQAICFNNLGFELSRNGQHEEALELIERSVTLKEQGYAYVSALAAAYGDKSQILMELGRFQEALLFDEKALTEIQRCADTGDALSKDEVWIYKVNRGCLYLRLGRVEEAEQLLQEAYPHIRPERRMYRMFAKQAQDEIKEWRRQATSPEHQLDWRWIGRFRELVAYDGYGWLAHAGPFTEEEQQQWDHLFEPHADQDTWEQLAPLMVQSRERELKAAIAEQREPRLRYPAIVIEEVRRRIAGLLQLDTEISQQEPNAIVRRLYQGAIEEDVDFLRLIEATYEGDTDKYWECNLRILLLPTAEEVGYTLVPIKQMVLQGLTHPETREISQQLSEFMRIRLHLSLDVLPDAKESQEEPQQIAASSTQPQPMLSHQAAKKFFEAALQEGGCDGWRVEIDPKATHPRVEGGLHTLFLPNGRFRLDEVRYWFIHELVGHIGRNVAGEHSPLGLLGISTKNYQSTEEGFNYYHERQIANLHGQAHHEPKVWIGTLATGLASGVITPPQTFHSLATFLELYALLHRLLRRPDADVQKAREQAQEYALHICLRAFRGAPDLERAGICYLQDSMYLRGIRMIERAVAEDKTVLNRLAVGKVALELLPDLQELGIVSAPQPLRRLAYDPDLDAHILSFEQAEEQPAQ